MGGMTTLMTKYDNGGGWNSFAKKGDGVIEMSELKKGDTGGGIVGMDYTNLKSNYLGYAANAGVSEKDAMTKLDASTKNELNIEIAKEQKALNARLNPEKKPEDCPQESHWHSTFLGSGYIHTPGLNLNQE